MELLSRTEHERRHWLPTCKYGHPMSGENLYISPSGTRNCRACNRRTSLDWYHKHKNDTCKASGEPAAQRARDYRSRKHEGELP
jgi:ribosomal protein L37E